MVELDHIAVCLSCGNEWEVREAGAKKRKCPVCGKYKVRMKDEIEKEKAEKKENPEEKAGEKQEEKIGEAAGTPPAGSSPEEKAGEKEEEKTEENRGGALLLVTLVVVAAGSLWFLWSAVRARRAENVDSEEEMRRYGVWA